MFSHASTGRARGARAILLFATLSLAACGGGGEERGAGDGGPLQEDADPALGGDGAVLHEGGDGGTPGPDAGLTPRDDGTCDVAAHCKAPESACATAVCINHSCHEAILPSGSELASQVAGDCQKLVCEAGGSVVIVVDPQDTPADDGDPCTEGVCQGGMPAHVSSPPGARLPEASQLAGDCRALVCGEGGELVSEVATDDLPVVADPCKTPLCDGGNPGSASAAPGSACGEDSVCNGSGQCVACVAAEGACTADWQCCGGACSGNQCSDAMCTPGERSCRDSKTIVRCAEDGRSHEVDDTCGAGTHCEDVLFFGPTCSANPCEANQPACDGDVATRCSADGLSYLPGGTDCAASGKGCSAGACVEDVRVDTVNSTSIVAALDAPSLEANSFKVTEARTLSEFEVYMRTEVDENVTFVVYEGTTGTSFTRIFQRGVVARAGTGYVSSGPVSVPLVAGRFYAVGISWAAGEVSTTSLASAPALSFGEYRGYFSSTLHAPEMLLVSQEGISSGVGVGQRIHTRP